MEWVIKRISNTGDVTYLNSSGWGLLCEDTKVFKGEWYANHAIQSGNYENSYYTYKSVRIPVLKPRMGDLVVISLLGNNILGEVLEENMGRLIILGMENFDIFTSDIVKIVSERRFLICNSRFDENNEELLSYYNSGRFMMTGDFAYCTRYRAVEYMASDLEYVDGNINGDTFPLPVNQFERNYSLKIAKNYNPITFEKLDIE